MANVVCAALSQAVKMSLLLLLTLKNKQNTAILPPPPPLSLLQNRTLMAGGRKAGIAAWLRARSLSSKRAGMAAWAGEAGLLHYGSGKAGRKEAGASVMGAWHLEAGDRRRQAHVVSAMPYALSLGSMRQAASVANIWKNKSMGKRLLQHEKGKKRQGRQISMGMAWQAGRHA